jgi:hypothetical protein
MPIENYYFMRTLLNWLAEARHFNRLVAVTLRVTAMLIVPLGLVVFFKAGKVIFELPASGILGGIFFQLFFVLAIYCVVHGLFIRARDIDALPGGDYHMFPLAAILAKALGETLAAFIALVAVGGGIFVWFTGKGVGTILNPPPQFLPVFGDTTFMGGIEFMVGGVLSAILVLGLGYLLAQILQLLAAAAVHLRGQASTESGRSSATASESGYKLRSGTGH